MNPSETSDFRANRVTRNYIQTINAEPSRVQALICPVKEAEWLDGWDYDLIFSHSGVAEPGCVFISRSEGEKDTIWLMTKRDDQACETEFARITPGSRVAHLTVGIEDGGNHTSRVHITYTITALTEAGNRFIENFTEENFVKDMKFWEATMNHYLETGKALPLSDPEHWLKYESGKSDSGDIRKADPLDHETIICALQDWWGGRDLTAMLPKLFLNHFNDTSFVAENNGLMIGFLIGFLSPSLKLKNEAYVHFMGVHPDFRKKGIGKTLYERFFEICRRHGRTIVRACTSPVNRSSVEFHERIGFQLDPGDDEIEGFPVTRDYNRPGDHKVRFKKIIKM